MKRWFALTSLVLLACTPAFGQRVTDVPLTTNHMVYDTVSGKIYATVPSSAGADGNSVAVIDPATGNVDQTVYVGSEPDPIAVSDDGQFLYVGLDGSSLVQRVRIATMTPDFSFSLGNGPHGANYASDIAVLPGQPHSIAVSLDFTNSTPDSAIATIYDDGVARPETAPGGPYGSLAFDTSSDTLYSRTFSTLDTESVSPAGLSVTNTTAQLLSFPISYDPVNQLLYGGGFVATPSTDQLKGEFAAAIPGAINPNQSYPASMAPDPLHHAVYALYTELSNIDYSMIVGEFDSDTFLPIGSIIVPIQTTSDAFGTGAGDLSIINANRLAFRSIYGHVVIVDHGKFPGISHFGISPPTLASHPQATVRILLNRPAPESGLVVHLSANIKLPLSLPYTVYFPPGSIEQSFTMRAASATSLPLVQASYGIQTLYASQSSVRSANTPGFSANVRIMYQPHNRLLADPTTGLVYATVPSWDGGHGNSIVQISPQTLGHQTLGFVGSEPSVMALSDNGAYLYIGLTGAGSVARFDLADSAVGDQFSLGNDPNLGPYLAQDMAVMPGEPDDLAVHTYSAGFSSSGLVRVFTNGVAAAGAVQGFDSIAVNPGIPDRIYGYGGYGSSSVFARMSFDNSMLSELNSQQNLLDGSSIAFDNGKLFSSGGSVIDPESLTLLGTFPGVSNGALVLPDSTDGYVYFVNPPPSAYDTYMLYVYDPNTYLLVASYPLTDVEGTLDSLCRTGPNRLVFGTSDGQVVFVNAAPAALLDNSLARSGMKPGDTTTGTITISNVAPIGGATITLSCADHNVIIPATVTVPVGEMSVKYTVGAKPVNMINHAVIRAMLNGAVRGAKLNINP